MPGHRLLARLFAACALAFVSLPASASAQIFSPFPQPVPGPGPYSRPGPPYGQAIPYSQPPQPGYLPLRSASGEDLMSDRAHSWPVMRVSPGAGLHFDGTGEVLPSFDLDVVLGTRMALSRRFFLLGEMGYTFSSEPTYGGHFGAAGLGPAVYLARMITIGWIPKLVIGETGLGFGVGVRSTLVVPMMMHVIHLELGHQFLVTEGREVHEARAQIGIDLAAAVHFYAWRVIGRGR